MFVLIELAHADLLGEFDSREEALAALRRVVEADPAAANECGVVELDKAGRRVGEPVTVRSTAAA